MFQQVNWSTDMAEITYFVMVPFKDADGDLFAEQGVQCPSEGSAKAQARHAVAKGAIGAIAFKRSGDPGLGEYGEAILICKEGELPDDVMEMLAA
jgi:ABC-type branched-subunit amino acid transport system substrate-binding protein